MVGMDKSPEMIRIAREKYSHLEFRVADATNFQFEKPFDAIFSNAVLHWVLDYKACISCMYKNLKDGGRMALEFGGEGNIQNILRNLRSTLRHRNLTANAEREVWYFPSQEEYSSALESAGFRITYANHFERPTELKGDLIEWLSMFAGPFISDIPEHEAREIKEEVQVATKSSCFKNGRWYADYKRLRVAAVKVG